MSLTSYPFEFYESKEKLLKEWGDVFSNCSGKIINKIYGVWDNLSGEWFGEAPMLIEFSHGVLSVATKSERSVALAWNSIFPSEKPVWFDSEQLNNMPELGWKEDLSWREYSTLSDCFWKKVRKISPLYYMSNLTGLLIELESSDNIIISDYGDVTRGFKATDFYIERIMEELHIQQVGKSGLPYIDLICPMENADKFIDKMNELKIRIIGFTWWRHATAEHEACGMGGVKCKYTSGYYSEIQMEEVIEFDSNEEVRNFLIKEYPKSKYYKPCFVPGFWLDLK